MPIVVSALPRPTTVIDIIHGALRILQVKSPDSDLTSDETNDALEALNLMIDSWSNESLIVYRITKTIFSLVPGQSSYTIGSGANFNTAKPIAIEAATITINGTDWPVQPVAFDTWLSVRQKTLSSSYSDFLYYDETHPTGVIYFYPVPNTAGSTITLYTRSPLDNFNNTTEEIILPKGYARALKYNLAVELSSEYGKPIDKTAITIARESKAILKRTNTRTILRKPDIGFSAGRFNINRG